MPPTLDRTPDRTGTASFRSSVERVGEAICPPAALLAFTTAAICAFSLLSTPQFDGGGATILAVHGAVLVLSGRFSHPILRFITTAAYLGTTALVVSEMGLKAYLAELAGPRDMGDPFRVFIFTTAQLVSTLLTIAIRRLPP